MNSRRTALSCAIAIACTLLAGCSGMDAAKPSATAALMARAALMPTAAVNPNSTMGTVAFTALGHGVRVAGEVRGLPPGTEHGFHIHEKGDCGNNGDAAGGHFNPAGGVHGKFTTATSHAGDLQSLVADASGVARFSIEVHAISLAEGTPNNVVGRALVVHRDRDDFATQPTGNAGPRVACAVIQRG